MKIHVRRVFHAVLAACLLLPGAWSPVLASEPSAGASSSRPGSPGPPRCERPQALEEAIARARAVIADADLLQLCTDALLRGDPAGRCRAFDPSRELPQLQRSIASATRAILAAWRPPGSSTDILPGLMLTNLRGESDQIDDLLGVVDDGRLGAIERCSGGPASANCLLLRFGCSGDYKCYSDNTCACYTCNGGSCGIN